MDLSVVQKTELFLIYQIVHHLSKSSSNDI
jgi:hypothetical protein